MMDNHRTPEWKRPLLRSRSYLAVARRSVRILFHEGPASFWHRLKRRIRRYIDEGNLYPRWIALNEPALEELDKLKRESLSFEYRPLIGIIMIIRSHDFVWLRSAVNSVISQAYENWILYLFCVDSDGSRMPQVLKEYEGKDSRIKLISRADNRGFAENTNEVLALASSVFVGFLDQSDELSPFALHEIVKALNADPQLDFIYSDEDKMDSRGKRRDPFFKPDWSPDTFLSGMYTGRFSIYRKKLVDSLGGLRPGYDGFEEFDLVLRIIEKTRGIYHIPRILYHRRITPHPASSPQGKRERREEAGKKALSDYLARNHINGEVYEGLHSGSYRIKREIMGNPLVSIIVPTKDKINMLKRCVESILQKTDYTNYEIIIVDNQSQQSEELVPYYRKLQELPQIRIIEFNQPFNFAALNNNVVPYTRGEIILFLNNDMEVISSEWLSSMVEQVQRKEVGAVGAKLLYPDGMIQHCGVIVGLEIVARHPYRRCPDIPGYFGRVDMNHNYSAVTAACMMVRKEVFQETNGFDENLAVDYNDIDFCLKLREKGYLVVYTPYARLYHLESYTRGYIDNQETRIRCAKEVDYFTDKWGPVLKRGDPYYNPNLSLTKLDFSIELNRRRNL
jgi:GT2 family glycosyltransferase